MIEIEKIEKSNVMEDHYSQSDDPWGNRKRQLYQTILKEASQRAFKYLDSSEIIRHYDIGVGGGNILDTIKDNAPSGITLYQGGCDISQSAINYINDHYITYCSEVIDCEEYDPAINKSSGMATADLVTIVDVMYYFGEKRDYRTTLDKLWETFKSGAVIVVADTIIPYQRRSYFKSKPDCEVLEEFTEYSAPAGQINGTNKNRYLKVKIYRKL